MQHLVVFLILWYTFGTAWFTYKVIEVEIYTPKNNRPPLGPKWWEWPLFWAATATMWPYAMWIYFTRPSKKKENNA